MKKKKATLYVICGLPASGKTTFAKQIINNFKAIHLSEDEWIKVLIGRFDDDKMRDNIAKLHLKMALRILRAGASVVMDGGFYSKKERDNLRDTAKKADACFKLYYMNTEFDVINSRRIARNKVLAPEFWTTEENFKKAVSSFEEPTKEEKAILAFVNNRPNITDNSCL